MCCCTALGLKTLCNLPPQNTLATLSCICLQESPGARLVLLGVSLDTLQGSPFAGTPALQAAAPAHGEFPAQLTLAMVCMAFPQETP